MEAAEDAAACKDEKVNPIRSAESAADPEKQIRAGQLSDPRDLPAASRGVVRLLFSLIQVMYLSFYIASLVSLHETERALERMPEYQRGLFTVILVTALVGIPVRLYLLSGAAFGYRGLTRRFLSLFPFLFALDELCALSPFLLGEYRGMGLALAAPAALLYLPFSQRSLLLMGERDSKSK